MAPLLRAAFEEVFQAQLVEPVPADDRGVERVLAEVAAAERAEKEEAEAEAAAASAAAVGV